MELRVGRFGALAAIMACCGVKLLLLAALLAPAGFLAGDIWSLLLPNIAVMLAIGAVFFVLAARGMRKRIA